MCHDSDGRVGVGSGDAMHGFEDYGDLFLGRDPLDLERHSRGARQHRLPRRSPVAARRGAVGSRRPDPRPAGVAIAGRSPSTGCDAYASSQASTGRVADMVVVAHVQIGARLPGPQGALRASRRSTDDLAVVHAVRDAVGDGLELMVDCNQGWRMPWDTTPPWTVDHATGVAEALAAESVYWMEEPLHRGDYAGHVRAAPAGGRPRRRRRDDPRALRVPRAAGPGLPRRVPARLRLHGRHHRPGQARRQRSPPPGRTFTPHTWGNGIGLLANLHLTAGHGRTRRSSSIPFDPPEWTPARRDYPLAGPLEPDGEGWLELTDEPGLGIHLDEERLAATRSGQASFT